MTTTLLFAGKPVYPAVLVHVTDHHWVDDMSSENPSGADNQQERPSPSDWLDAIPIDVGHYIAGFVEGEGSFNVPIIRE